MFSFLFAVSAIIALVMSSLTIPATDNNDIDTNATAPVQILSLTKASGDPTTVATAGLDTITLGSGQNHGKAVIRVALLSHNGTNFDPARDAAILTEPLEVPPFMVAGLTWSADSILPSTTQIFLRIRKEGQWSQWYLTDSEVGSGKDDESLTVAGTEPFVTGGADAIQIRVTGPEEDLPANLQLSMIPDQPDGEEYLENPDLSATAAPDTDVNDDSLADGAITSDFESVTPPADVATSQSGNEFHDDLAFEHPNFDLTPNLRMRGLPTDLRMSPGVSNIASSKGILDGTLPADLSVSVRTRSQWGANESAMTWAPEYAAAPFVVVHHTAGTNDYTRAQAPSVVRGIYHYHAVTLGWGDIGYHFLVDKWGQAYEGRSGTLAAPRGQMPEAAHARGYNVGTMGISMMGNYSSVTPSTETLATVGQLAGWQLARAGVSDPSGSGYYARQGRTIRRIVGHRDVNATACPGDAAYSKMDMIRSAASGLAAAETADKPGWRQVTSGTFAGKWVYFNQDLRPHTGWLKESGNYYLLDTNGIMLTGWQYRDGAWYYLTPNGAMATGLINDQGSHYYLDTTGEMKTGWFKTGDRWMWAASSGRLVKGWAQIDTKWYYFDADFKMLVGVHRIGTASYLLTNSGHMAVGWALFNNTWYHASPNGDLTTGWVFDNGRWYYLNADFKMRTGWLTDKNKEYYLTSTGAMATNRTTIADKVYFFHDSGHKMTGWAASGSTWYYADTAGVLTKGWKLISGTWYYFDANQEMHTGWLKLGSTWYWMDSSGAMATGSRVIGNATHIFNSDGAWIREVAANPTQTFTATNIVSDEVLFNPHTMTVAQIQSFLNEKGSACRPSPGGAACLKDYRHTSQTMKLPYCAQYTGAANETAAQVMYKAAQACGVNPQALIVILQKEQGLVTASSSALTATKYSKAMGFACPDSAPCSSAYATFSLQMYGAASRLVQYTKEPQRFNHAVGRSSWVGYHPNSACGGTYITPENKATAALYNYTPYQPNAAALANMTGVGDSCSTYGNRNFWRTFNTWFGSTH